MTKNISGRSRRRVTALLAGPIITVGMLGLTAPTAMADTLETAEAAVEPPDGEGQGNQEQSDQEQGGEEQGAGDAGAEGTVDPALVEQPAEQDVEQDAEQDAEQEEGQAQGGEEAGTTESGQGDAADQQAPAPEEAEGAEDGAQARAADSGGDDDAADAEGDDAGTGANDGDAVDSGDDSVDDAGDGGADDSADDSDAGEVADGEAVDAAAVQEQGSDSAEEAGDSSVTAEDSSVSFEVYSFEVFDLPDEPTSGWLGAAPEGNQGGGQGIVGMSDEIQEYMSDAVEYDEDLWWAYDPDAATVCALPERGSEDLGPLEEGPDDGSTGVWGLVAGDQFWAVYNDFYDILAFVPEHQLWLEGAEQPWQAYAGCGHSDSSDPVRWSGSQEDDPDPQGAPADLADWQLYYALGLDEPGEDLMPPGALQKLYDHPAYTGQGHTVQDQTVQDQAVQDQGAARGAARDHDDAADHRDASVHGGEQLAETGADSSAFAMGAGLFVLIGGALTAFAYWMRLRGRHR